MTKAGRVGVEKKAGFTHDNKENVSEDWYTPEWIFEGMGLTFDLDPCSPVGGRPWIPAKKVYSLPDDGLTMPWEGLVWLNPPYGKFTGDWIARMDTEHRNGVAIAFARTDCRWFQNHAINADAMLLLKGRVKFVDGLGKTSGQGAGAGSVLFAWGAEAFNGLWRMRDKGLFISLSRNREELDFLETAYIDNDLCD